MHRFSKHLWLLLIPFICCSCKQQVGKYPYAIKDFPVRLQPRLVKIIERGFVTYTDTDFVQIASNEDLAKLGKSEHPILRATAFREMLNRKSFNHFNIIMEHLDDTALVFTDGGEFGLWNRLVSDDILQEAEWETQTEKDKTIEAVLTRHNYLRAAYIILDNLPAQEKYYPFIRDMATRPRRLEKHEGYELGFADIEHALYGLAKFKKKNDIAVISQHFLENVPWLSDRSFRLMATFPDTTYYKILKDYHRRTFYRFSGNRPYGFTGIVADRAAPEDFIGALVMQQTDSSAALLDSMLKNLDRFTNMPDRENIINEVISSIWEHPCPAYQGLREKIKSKAVAILASQASFSMEPISTPFDSIPRKITWYR